jgi:L-amino acid N-acyltransferase YncA
MKCLSIFAVVVLLAIDGRDHHLLRAGCTGKRHKGRSIGQKLYGALFEAIAEQDIRRIVAGYVLPNQGSAKLHEQFGFKVIGVFSENGRKFGKYWDVIWSEQGLRI